MVYKIVRNNKRVAYDILIWYAKHKRLLKNKKHRERYEKCIQACILWHKMFEENKEEIDNETLVWAIKMMTNSNAKRKRIKFSRNELKLFDRINME